jgi:translation initiation factor 2 subunit 1
MKLEEGDIVLCTVERIEKTVVFVKIHTRGKDLEGSIITSEIAPGRIRNIRNYVVPNKKIACKVLRVSGDRIDLSLRRVTNKEKKEVMDEYNQEKSYISIIKSVLGEKAEKIIKEIEKESNIYEFIEEAKENPKKLEKIAGKKAEDILKIVKKQKKRKAIVKKEFYLSSIKPNGVKLIKDLLKDIKDIEIKYISAGKYTIKKESKDLKKADNEIMDTLEKLSKKAKDHGMILKYKEK